MYRQNPTCELPSNLDAYIWRYMDFTKFVAILESRRLHFTRTDSFQDKFEGSLTRPDVEELNATFEKAKAKHPDSATKLDKLRKLQREMQKTLRECAAINCWHLNKHESAAMWSLYTKEHEGIAVRSTVRRLIDSFDKNDTDIAVMVGEVTYLDYDLQSIPRSNEFFPILHKRESYRHENELRAIAIHYMVDARNQREGWTRMGFPESGVDLVVNLETLIDCVFVAPTSPAWYESLVRHVAAKYAIGKPIRKSNLTSEPIW